MSTQKILTGILIGAAAGAVLGILFAPDKGSETRKKLADKSSDLADTIKTKASHLSGEVSNKFNAAKDGLSDLIGKGQEKFQGYKKQAENELS
ncbi:hypothetical protein BH11BAC6_BH11BAC6_02420 [soil metagenome]